MPVRKICFYIAFFMMNIMVCSTAFAVDVLNITTTPTLAGSGDTITVTFQTSELVQDYPIVTIGGLAMIFAGYGGGVYSYEYQISGLEPEGYQDVQIDVYDLVGNHGSGSQSNATQFLWDVTPTPTSVFSSLGKAVLAPVPATRGKKVCMFYTQTASSSVMDIHNTNGEKLSEVSTVDVNNHCWDTMNAAPGVYFVKIEVKYQDGKRETLWRKAVVIP